jgi:CRP-like cAMP-binding protein
LAKTYLLARRNFIIILPDSYAARQAIFFIQNENWTPMDTSATLAFKAPARTAGWRENKFLAQLPAPERERLLPDLRETDVAAGSILLKAGEAATRVFFPINCVISITSAPVDGVDVALVGSEGLLIPGPTGSSLSMFNALVQVPGQVAVADAEAFDALCEASPAARRLLQRWHYALLFQSQQVAACNAVHDVEKRLCRWLLQFYARTRIGMLPVTQEMLANMLGVQRTTVTLVAHRLRNKGVLRQRRGRIELVNMSLLEQSACDCHWSIEATCEAVMSKPAEPLHFDDTIRSVPAQ